MTEPKLCKDCLHFRESHPIAGAPKCHAPQRPAKVDLVYGRRPGDDPRTMRLYGIGMCGESAEWFLAK